MKVGGLQGRVIETPGHTAGHISYFFPADKLAFVGDTLFSIGCGRVIEGNPEMMWHSLLKLRDLPDDTQFYCGHEYTDANIRFAKTIEPNNKALAARAEEVSASALPPARRQSRRRSEPRRRPIRSCAPTMPKWRNRSGSLAARPGKCSRKSASARTGFERANFPQADVIRLLDLKPHPEGGHFREMFRDTRRVDGDRAASTAIYFLLARGERSHWHRVDAVEIWHWHAGAPLELEIAHGKKRERIRLGSDLAAGERPQAIVPAHAWQAAQSLGDWTLVGCTVAPGFDFKTFELAPPGWEPR